VPTALVTGANRGIGLEVARQLAAAGFEVLAGARAPASVPEIEGVRAVRLDVTDQQTVGALTGMRDGAPAYSISKAALNALTLMLADALRRDGVLVNAVWGGREWIVATDMGSPGGRPVSDGARGIVWAATLPDDGPTGGFFRDGRPIDW